MNYNILGDIGGELESFEKLIRKMPYNAKIISVGDLVDRGPNSKELLDIFMKNKYTLIKGNHEHLFLDFLNQSNLYNDKYKTFLLNGGIETIQSFTPEPLKEELKEMHNILETLYNEKIVKEIISISKHFIHKKYKNYLNNLPLRIEDKKFIITHAPLNPKGSKSEESFLWNRSTIKPLHKIQIFGHQGGHLKLKKARVYQRNNSIFGICLDTTYHNILCGYNTKNNKFYYQEFI